MPTLRSSSVAREVCLRKQLLNKIFLKTLSHDDDPLDVAEPSSPAACPLKPPNSIREQPAISEMTEHDVEMKNEEILLENSVNISSSQNNAFDSPINSANLEDSASSMVITSQIGPTTEMASSETHVPTVKKSRRSCKKYSKILARIEGFERSVAIFYDKENGTPSGAAALNSHNSISVFKNITSSHQKKKYEKYFNKTLKVCTRLECEISLYSQYIATLETTIASIPKSSKLHKMLEVKLKTAYKFHEENPSHEELKMLMRQLKLVNLLIKKYETESENWWHSTY